MADHSPPGWWPTPPRRPLVPCPIVAAGLVAVAVLVLKGLIAWIR